MEFFEKLLEHLDMEEVSELRKRKARSAIFGTRALRPGGRHKGMQITSLYPMAALTLSKIKCRSCGHGRDSGLEKSFAFTTRMPRRKSGESTVPFTECLDAYSEPDCVEVHCNSCGRTTESLKWMEL